MTLNINNIVSKDGTTVTINPSVVINQTGNSVGNLNILGGLTQNVTAPSAYPYTILTTDNLIAVSTTAAARTINLPATLVEGQTYLVKDVTGQAATNNITISGNGNTIDGAASVTISVNYGAYAFIGGPSQWGATSINTGGATGITTVGDVTSGSVAFNGTIGTTLTSTTAGFSLLAINNSSGVGGAVSLTGGATTNATSAGGAATLQGGAGNTSGSGGLAKVLGGTSGVTGTGGGATLQAASGGTTSGSGGGINIFAGSVASGASSGSGGNINLSSGSGSGSSGNSSAGSIFLQASAPSGSGSAGLINISAGAAATTGSAGTVTINGGAGGSTSGNGGAVTINTGIGGPSGNGGTLTLSTRAGGSTSGIGGNINITCGNGIGTGTGGTITATAGSGGLTGSGGQVSIIGGAGGSTSGDGGSVLVNTGSASTSGVAGQLTLRTGSSVGTNQSAGLVLIRNGQGTGTGAVGKIQFQSNGSGTASGTGNQPAVNRKYINGSVALTTTVASTIATMTLASNSSSGGSVSYVVECTDGTNYQSSSGVVAFSAISLAGVKSGNASVIGSEAQTLSVASTLVNVFSVTSGGLLQVTSTTSLTPTFFQITYEINCLSAQQTITIP